MPDDLDLRSDSERPAAEGDRDSFMSIEPEPDEDSVTGRDSYLSVSPEPDDEDTDGYLEVSPESANPGRGSFAKISERPTEPRIEKPPLMPRVPRYEPAKAPRIAVRPAPLETPAAREAEPAALFASESFFDPKSLLEGSLPPPSEKAAEAAVSKDRVPRERVKEPVAVAAPSGTSPPSVDGVDLEGVETLGDLPEEAQAELASKARLVVLGTRQEFALPEGVVLITRGTAHVTLPHSDVSAGRVGQGALVAARGSVESGPLRLIADSAPTHVVTWSEADLTHAMRDCPWVVDDLRLLADRYQAHASAGLGPLGARLDDALRAAVYERLQVRVLSPDESVAERGKPLKGLFVVAVGDLEVDSGVPGGHIGSGEFVFPGCVIGAEPAPHDVKAGPKGGLVLFATRPVAHELMMSVPPLLEILAS